MALTWKTLTRFGSRYVFWIMFAISFLNYLDRYVLVGAANVIAKELNFQLDGIGFVTSAFLIVYTLGTIPLGLWADRSQRKSVVALCVGLWSVTTALTSLATNFLSLFIFRMILGIGEAGYFPAGTALMSDYFDREKRSRIMSWWSIAQLLGILGGYELGGVLAGLYFGSWRLAFLFTGLPGLVLAILAWFIREPGRNEADEKRLSVQPQDLLAGEESIAGAQKGSTLRASFSKMWSLLRIKTLVVLIIMQVFAYFVLGVSTTFLPTYLQQKDTFHLSSGTAGLYSGGVIVVAGIIGTLLGGYMADMLNRRHPGSRVLVCGVGFLVGAPAFAAAMLFHNIVSFTIFFVLSAILLTIYTGPCTAATQDVAPAALRASAVAISLLLAHLFGDAFSPSIVGILATALDPTHGLHFQAGMAGQDLSIAILLTCAPALFIAGLVGILGARWMRDDVQAAERADLLLRASEA
ncbi:MFS transporter [Ktedonosporobacter rubrisoli]|uniref:MFS transporter n=1 Tax=Ktedonosporobacter rubrisoli TaxID=2509675 RepID=A0A4P6JZZ8_KTERU|nr:MFS transporter [Ktedonosporobacter rubrisoli]QBD81359.1 MFS transporter [Ktedonosporobacter rubrisoli]